MRPSDEIRDRLVALTRDLILIPGTASRPKEREQCFEFVRNHVESLEHLDVRAYRCEGIPSLLALPPHTERPEVLLCGHLDVINHPDIGVYRSRIDDGRIYGPGAGDMKGSLAVLLEIFREFHLAYPEASIGLLVTADEETGGEHGVQYLFDEVGLRCGVAMIPDGGSLTEITVEEKGVLHLSAKTSGHAAHAARPWLGTNALEHLMTRLADVQSFFDTFGSDDEHWYPTCAVTILGTQNDTINRIPSEAQAVLDVRFPPPHSVESMLGELRTVLGPHCEVAAMLSADPVHLSPDSLYMEVTMEVTGTEPILVREAGSSDGRFMCRYGIPVLMSRPLIGEVHAENEWIDIDSMVVLYRIYEQYLSRKLF